MEVAVGHQPPAVMVGHQRPRPLVRGGGWLTNSGSGGLVDKFWMKQKIVQTNFYHKCLILQSDRKSVV